MRTVHLETTLPTSADRVWRAMQSPVTFLYVCKGLFAVPALSGRAEPLRAGERGTGWLFAFHYHMGAAGMWLGLIVGLTLASIFLGARFISRVQKA